MKKILFAALAALAITSCSQNEEIEAPTQKTEIKFPKRSWEVIQSCRSYN